MKFYVPIILGTARQGRQSEKAAKFVLTETEKHGLETELIDVRDFLNNQTSAAIDFLREKIKKSDGLIVVLPEYNHGYPGELKMMLDSFYEEYFKKPIGFCGVSAGMLGGVRGVEQLRQVAIGLCMVPIREAMYFSQIQNLFDEKGEIKDKEYQKRMSKFLEELVWHMEILKKGREKT